METSVQHDDGKRQHVTGVCNKTEGNRIYVDVMNHQLKHQTNFMQQRTAFRYKMSLPTVSEFTHFIIAMIKSQSKH